jgi:colanic acid/amylovoran biosynthesis protein
MDLDRPVALWGASVGPFDREPHFVETIAAHLARMKLLAVRESISETYLQDTMRVDHVTRMADPAFALRPDSNDAPGAIAAPGGTLGFNLSPLLERYRRDGGGLRRDAAAFIRHAVRERGMSVLLIPHVDGLRPVDDGDRAYLSGLLAMLGDLGGAVRMLPRGLNAPQTKAAIAQVRFFIGARTHAAIAALSSGIPTVSIAYSVKARGIHRDLLGDEQEVLPAQDVTEATLRAALDRLEIGEKLMRERLAVRVAHAQAEARRAARRAAGALGLSGKAP